MNSFSLSNAGAANLQIEGLDPIMFSLLGMLVVFLGLIFIALYIFLLPKILSFCSALKKRMGKIKEAKPCEVDRLADLDKQKEIFVAISAAFHLDQDFPEENQKITWLSHGLDESAWLATGIANGLSRRHNLHITRRKF